MIIPKIHWHINTETRFPFGKTPPYPDAFDPLGFPPPWPDRPWIYANMVASKNGVVAWKRHNKEEIHPVHVILGNDATRLERVADLLLMRYLRCFGDTSIGAVTNRDQPDLIQTPQEDWEKQAFPELQPISDALYKFRELHGLSHHPRQILYSRSGLLHLDNIVFNRHDLKVTVITTKEGEKKLLELGTKEKNVELIVMADSSSQSLIKTHQTLFKEGVRYLNCEGGETILRELRKAGILDEVFVTYSDVEIDESQHEGILRIFDFEAEGAELITEGKISDESQFIFRRWRFNKH